MGLIKRFNIVNIITSIKNIFRHFSFKFTLTNKYYNRVYTSFYS